MTPGANHAGIDGTLTSITTGVRGHVTAPDGTPLAGVPVTVLHDTNGYFLPTGVRSRPAPTVATRRRFRPTRR